jgi:hypothetical protein
MAPPIDTLLRTTRSAGRRYLAIAAKDANPKATAAFPIRHQTIESFDYALDGASQWWPGVTDWQLLGSDELFADEHADSAGFPAGSWMMKDPAQVCEFSAGDQGQPRE